MLELNLSRQPFSRYGSFIALSARNQKDVFIHSARRVFGEDKVFRIDLFYKGSKVVPTIEFTPTHVTMTHEEATLLFYIKGENAIVAQNEGFEVSLSLMELPSKNGDVPEEYPLAYGTRISENHLKIISVNARYCIGIHSHSGQVFLEGPFKKSERGELIDNKSIIKLSDTCLAEIDISPNERHPSCYSVPDVTKDIAEIEQEWNLFLSKIPDVPARYRESAVRSWYNLWASTVPPAGNYKYPTVVMSMEFMSSVWSWDHCFNALALAQANPELGLFQFFTPFEKQAKNGVLPDYVNPDLEVVFGVTKPPIHGWCFSKLMDSGIQDPKILRKAYLHLSKWTHWWLDYNDSDHDGLPEYSMGCDSGWDNSTVFDLGYFVESPDLTAFLVLQMRCLARIARRLKMKNAEKTWSKKADVLLEKLDKHFWEDDCYNAKVSGSHKSDKSPTSLIVLETLVLGHLLDPHKRSSMIERLKKMFLTDYGLATECYYGPYYKSDNYWRGAIWAPSTYLIVDGLMDAGETQLALEIARKFCDMIAFTAQGDFENFNALTGEGLRASGYTWTSSVNILLQQFILRQENQ